MSKISVIIAREYLTKVRNKWFIIATLLGPIGLALMIAIPVLAALLMDEGATGKTAVLDRTGILAERLIASDTAKYTAAGERTRDQLSEALLSKELQAYLVIPETVFDSGVPVLYSAGGTGIEFGSSVERDMEPLVTEERLRRRGVDTSVLAVIERGVNMDALKITEEGVEQDSSTASAVVGYISGFMIYMLIFIYGSVVMRGVVEEKANRIIEVIASSARPYEIMMGKVVGIGLVGLTQVVAWLVLGIGVMFIAGSILTTTVDPQQAAAQMQQLQGMQGAGGMTNVQATQMMIGDVAIPDISPFSLLLFLFYFLGGYFLYATLFAAVGSAVDQESDASQLTFPITMPVIITIMFIGNVVANPNGTLAVVLSLIPLFTPILMAVRIAATDVPWWQIALSIVNLVAAFLGAVWVASRIYRIGILSYGKKPSLKDLAKWVVSR
jgi:ABC-2 type transport system permease protein